MRYSIDGISLSMKKAIEQLEMGNDIGELREVFKRSDSLQCAFNDWYDSDDNDIDVSFFAKYYPKHTVKDAFLLFYINYVNMAGWNEAVQQYLRVYHDMGSK